MVKIKCGKCNTEANGVYLKEYYYQCGNCEAVNDVSEGLQVIKPRNNNDDKVVRIENNLTVREWVNFDYQNYIGYILAYINTYNFNDIRALNQEELEQGYLNDKQVTKFKKILKQGIELNWSLNQIIDKVKNDVKPGDLTIYIEPMMEDGEVVRNGYEKVIGEDTRTETTVRSEVTRATNNGAMEQYKEFDIDKVKSSASLGERTCEFCLEMDGEVFVREEMSGWGGWHPNCNCIMLPVVLEE